MILIPKLFSTSGSYSDQMNTQISLFLLLEPISDEGSENVNLNWNHLPVSKFRNHSTHMIFGRFRVLSLINVFHVETLRKTENWS